MIGTWCTPEILKAVECGYRVVKIYEVYHFPQTSVYDRTNGTGGLFADFINTFLKIKQESSGWPGWCKTEADKELYVNNYKDREGVRLDPDSIAKNPGRRSLAKLLLNR